MKTKIILVLLYFAINQSFSQNLLKTKWKFKTGDDVSWARIEHDDSQWSDMLSGQYWEAQGIKNYDGFAWYRMSVLIPSSLKKNAEKMGGLLLNLGAIDDVDYTYFNGQLIGKTGEIPPNLKAAYADVRKYEIPISRVLWDKINVIAVRVFDATGGGGMYSENTSFSVKGTADNFKLDIEFPIQNQVFTASGDAFFGVKLQSSIAENFSGKIKINVFSDFADSITSVEKNISIKPNKSQTIPVVLKSLKPGIYNGIAYFESAIANKKMQFSFAIQPEKISSPTDAMPDFDAYWNRAKKELEAIDPQYNLIKIDSLSKGNRDVFVVEMRSLGNVLVRGWYAIPKKSGKYPAILHLQGYSSFNKLDWAYPNDDIIVFVLNIRGHGFSKDNIDPGFPGYLQHSIADKEMYIYRGAYMDTRRALDFMLTRAEIDKSKIAVEGGSQGGALSIAAAALNNDRVSLCIPHVPFLSDFKDYFKIGRWPGSEFVEYVNKNPQVGWAKVYETLSYIDIKNLAPYIKCPTFMGIGLIDDICPPHINFAAYNQIKTPKEYIVYPKNGHGLPAEYHTLKYVWLKKQWGMK